MQYHCFLVVLCSISLASLSLEANVRYWPRNPTIGIVGGDEADIEDFPYIAAALQEEEQFCGAALIGDDTALSAAHCLFYDVQNVTGLSLRLGSSQWRSGGQEIKIKEIIIHENYTTDQLDYDIAIIKLSEKVNVGNATSVSLPPANKIYSDGILANVSGWGVTSDGEPSETLRYVEVPVVDEDTCRKSYGSIISERTICAGYKEGGKDSCQRDSGGPLVINGELAGIVSFGNGCGEPNYPGVYAAVSAFRNWIKEHSGI